MFFLKKKTPAESCVREQQLRVPVGAVAVF